MGVRAHWRREVAIPDCAPYAENQKCLRASMEWDALVTGGKSSHLLSSSVVHGFLYVYTAALYFPVEENKAKYAFSLEQKGKGDICLQVLDLS